MGLLSRFSGFRLTVVAAVLTVTVAVLANPFTGLIRFGSHRAGPIATIVGSIVMAGALLDRWRPMRWLVRVTTFFAALTYAGLALAGVRPTVGYAAMAVLCGTISTILGSKPVRRWFSTPPNEWGSAAEEALVGWPQPTPLPPEKVETDVARPMPRGEPAANRRPDAGSSPSPDRQ